MNTPRLLPLVAVAVGGVLALKMLGAADALPAFLSSSRARAEAPSPHAKPGSTPLPPAAKPAAAPGICAPTAAELAKEAGLSPAELQMLQSLGTRRGQLDAREQALDAQIQLLAAAEIKVDAKIKALNVAKAQVEAMVGQADSKTQAEVDRLVVVYEKMKPRDAGAIFAALDDKVRVPVAAKIAAEKPAILSAILAQMGTLEAKKLTESLAHRFDAARAAAEAAQNPTKAGAAKAEAAAPDAKPLQVASADGAASPPPEEGGAAKASAKPAPRPARRPAPRPAHAAKPLANAPRPAAAKAPAAKPTGKDADTAATPASGPASKATAPTPPPASALKAAAPPPAAPSPAKA